MEDIKVLWDPSQWTFWRLFGVISGIAFFALIITFTIMLGIYAYGNPDPAACWVIKGVQAPGLTREAIIAKAAELSVEVPEGYPVEMHKLYVTWFSWGFWTNMSLAIVMIVSAVIAIFWRHLCLIVLGLVAIAGWFISLVIWVVFGFIWRFTTGGTIAAGDWLVRDDGQTSESWEAELASAQTTSGYQLKSGSFLKGTCFFVTGGLVLAILVFAFYGVVSCFYSDDKAESKA